MLFWTLLQPAVANPPAQIPRRAAPEKPAQTIWVEGRERDVVIVKLAREGASPPDGASPLFSRSPEALRATRAAVDPGARLADLTLYHRVQAPPGEGPALADALNRRDDVEIAYLAFAPQPPPEDIPPTTPDYADLQSYLGPAPEGLGFDAAAAWPGGDGANVAVADLEYSWNDDHEDLGALQGIRTWGRDAGQYGYHGDGVWGILIAGDDGYGVVGAVPAAEPVGIYPYTEAGAYSVADAIEGAAAMLEPGDVLLIEQQSWAYGNYCPVSIDPATFDAITLAVAQGIVVVEPAGNGAQDLDGLPFGDWFDRGVRDSGSIMVGGGASPNSGYPARSYYPSGGSCHGERVDVQGWYDGIVTATSGDYGGWLADLFYPDGDDRQAYTQSFGGTSGASPMIAGAAAAFQSAMIALHGEPMAPMDLRALMVSTGTPQDPSRPEHIGPQPDLRRMMRYALVP